MHEQMQSSAADDLILESELEKLFALQDRNLNKEKKSIWVRELQATNIPLKAILSGIRALTTEDVQSLKFATVCAAARKYIEHTPETGRRCEHCSHGIVSMRDAEGRNFALACVCDQGAGKAATQGLVRWNGEAEMHSKGRILSVPFRDVKSTLFKAPPLPF